MRCVEKSFVNIAAFSFDKYLNCQFVLERRACKDFLLLYMTDHVQDMKIVTKQKTTQKLNMRLIHASKIKLEIQNSHHYKTDEEIINCNDSS